MDTKTEEPREVVVNNLCLINVWDKEQRIEVCYSSGIKENYSGDRAIAILSQVNKLKEASQWS